MKKKPSCQNLGENGWGGISFCIPCGVVFFYSIGIQ